MKITTATPTTSPLSPATHAILYQEKGRNGDCSITYGFEARLHRPGILNFDATSKSELTVLSKPQEAAASMPVLVGPETQRVTRCCCFNKGRSVAAMMVMFPVVCAGSNGVSRLVRRGGPTKLFHFFDLLPYNFPLTSMEVSVEAVLLSQKLPWKTVEIALFPWKIPRTLVEVDLFPWKLA